MFDASNSLDDQPAQALAALPHAAVRCLRACGCTDHAHAEELRWRSAGENNRDQKRRTRRLKVDSKQTEARAREFAREAR
jgi:hypothetical protein